MLDLISPNFKSYADKIKADFIVIDDCRMSSHPVLEKLRVSDYLEDYDRIILMDADIVIRPDCPNLFDLIPEDRLGAYNEGGACPFDELRDIRLRVTAETGKFYSLEPPDWTASKEIWSNLPYYNSGLMVLSKQHKPIFHIEEGQRPLPVPLPHLICTEQGIINFRIWKHRPKMFHLPVCFNQMPWNSNRDSLMSSYIMHFAGMPFDDRLKLMKEAHDFFESFFTWN